MKNFLQITSVVAAIIGGCLAGYMVVRDATKEHEVKLKYIEKASVDQKKALEKVETRLFKVEQTLITLVVELKHLTNRRYHEKVSSNANGRYVLRDPDDGM